MTIEQVTCSSLSRSREWTDKFCMREATQPQHRHSCLPMLTSGPPHSFVNLMNLGGCLPPLDSVVQVQPLLEGLGKKLVWMLDLMGTACLLLPTIHRQFPSPHPLGVRFHLLQAPPWARKMRTSVPGKTYLLLLHSSLVKTTYFRNRKKSHFPDFMSIILFHRNQHFGKNIAWYCKYNFCCFKNCYAAVKDHLLYQHPQQITTLSIYTLLLSPWFWSTYISTLNTDLADGKAFQDTFLAGPKAHAISTKVHYNSQHPLKPKANPASNFSRGL